MQDHEGTWHYTLFVQNGRVLDRPSRPMRTGLAEIARVHRGDFRLTANQNLMIARVRPRQKRRVEKLLAQYRLDNDHSGLRLNSLACVALPTCGLALAESERYLPDLVTALEEVTDGRACATTTSDPHDRLPERLRAPVSRRDRPGRAHSGQVQPLSGRGVRRLTAEQAVPSGRRA